jgi:hypothetical protein
MEAIYRPLAESTIVNLRDPKAELIAMEVTGSVPREFIWVTIATSV